MRAQCTCTHATGPLGPNVWEVEKVEMDQYRGRLIGQHRPLFVASYMNVPGIYVW